MDEYLLSICTLPLYIEKKFECKLTVDIIACL